MKYRIHNSNQSLGIERRIVFCVDSVCYPGGIGRYVIVRANALSQLEGYDVWVAVSDNNRPPVCQISEAVHLVDLHVNYYEDDWKGLFYVMKGFLFKRRIHRKRLGALLGTIVPDIVISVGTSEKLFIPRFKRTLPAASFIREIHFTTDYRQLDADGWFASFSARIAAFVDYRLCIRGYDRIVVLTKEDKQRNWSDYSGVEVIPNPVRLKPATASDLKSKRALAVGRFTRQKDFPSLIRAWSRVASRHSDWKLDIYGSGGEYQAISAEIEKNNLSGVVSLKGETKDIEKEMLSASMLIMTSLYEGFGNVIIEAMSCGLPVVSYACPCGPKDIITDGVDGFLVPPKDEETLAERICRLIEDETLRCRLGGAALERSKDFGIERVLKMWTDLFTTLQNTAQR